MVWRKWLVRILVFTAGGMLAAAAFLYEHWTDPASVREQVLAQLRAHFPGANVSLDSAHLRLLGGIALSGLVLSRKDDPDRVKLADVESAIVYHDKEQLVEGRLAIRKIELHRPTLRLTRGRDGRWSFDGVLGQTRSDQPMPTIVVSQGTLVVEDRGTRGKPGLEVHDVNLTMLNDPLSTVSLQMRGASELLGSLEAVCSWERSSGRAKLSLRMPCIPIGSAAIARVAAYYPEAAEHARRLRGLASLVAEAAYQPGLARPWTHDVRVHLSDGSLVHPRIPIPLDHLEADFRCLPGEVRLASLSARSGETRLSLQGTAQACSLQADLRGELRIERLPLTASLFHGEVPANFRKVHEEYDPHGPVNVRCRFRRQAGRWSHRSEIEALGLTATFHNFRYPLEGITGTLRQSAGEGMIDRLDVDLVGRAEARPVYIRGTVLGEGPKSAVRVDVWGAGLPINDKLRAALPAHHRTLADSFHPQGLVDFEAYVRREAGGRPWINRYVVHFHRARLCYDLFPYPLEEVSGVLDIQPDHWEFRDFRGLHRSARVRCGGRSRLAGGQEHLEVTITGQSVPLDKELEAALVKQPELRQAWVSFAPTGHMDFQARVDRPPGQPPDVQVSAAAYRCTIRPAFFPYRLDDLSGSFHYAHRQIRIENVQARHGQTVLALDNGDVRLKEEGVWAKLADLRFTPLVPDDDLVAALPQTLQRVCRTLELKDPIELRTLLVLDTRAAPDDQAVVYWDGELGFRDASLNAGVPLEHVTGRAACHGRCEGHQLKGLLGNVMLHEAMLFRQPFRQVHTHVEVHPEEPEVLRLPNLTARIYDGTVGGEARVEFGSLVRYELKLNASEIRLEEFGRQNLAPGTKLSGLAAARLYLSGQGADVSGLTGQGLLDVPDGRLYNLPVLLDLLKVLGFRRPDGTMFEQAHAEFTIRGTRVAVNKLDLLGNSFSATGQGEMNLDGTDIHLDFYAAWAQALQMLPPILKDLPTAMGKYLLKIQVRGKLGDVRVSKEPVPVLVEPLKQMLERMSRSRGRPTATSGQ